MKNIKLLLLAVLVSVGFSSCEEELEAPGTSYATFEAPNVDVGVEQGGSTTADIKIYTANITGSARTINVTVDTDATTADAGAYSVPASVAIPAGSNLGTLSVGINDVGLDSDKVLVLKLEQTADIDTGGNITIGLSQVCPNNGVKVKVTLTFDSWPEEVAWRILDSGGNTVAASADPFAFGAYAGLSGSVTESYCLASGDYTMEISDFYGDGGTDYAVTANGTPLFGVAATDYTASTTVDFSI